MTAGRKHARVDRASGRFVEAGRCRPEVAACPRRAGTQICAGERTPHDVAVADKKDLFRAGSTAGEPVAVASAIPPSAQALDEARGRSARRRGMREDDVAKVDKAG